MRTPPTVTPALQLVSERCTSRGARGVVSSAAPEAASIGLQALRAGGNAFDAALHAGLAETVLLPSKCGLAGDLVALCQRAGEPPRALVAIGPAAAALSSAVAQRGKLDVTGGLSVGVPAAPAGYAELSRLGRHGLATAIRPAIALARDGYAWSLISYRYAEDARRRLAEENPDGTVYLPGGRPAAPGTHVKLPGMADALVQFKEMGTNLFEGPLGEALVSTVQRRGGVITLDDLSQGSARWEEPCVTSVGGRTVWATPTPTHGPSLLDALERAWPDTRSTTLWQSVDQALRDRRSTAGDSAGDTGTSVVAAADAEGNAVLLVHSNSHPTFASGVVVPGYDLILSNRAGRGFSADPNHPNFPASGRRPVTTLHAWALGDPRSPQVFGATSGGENQMGWNAQVLDRLLRGIDPALAHLLPLWGRRPDGSMEAEEGIEPDAMPGGAPVDVVPTWGIASGFQVLDVGGPMLSATSDIRCIGGSAGF